MPARRPEPQPLSAEDARDLQLVRQVRAGGPAERQAWGELVRRYQDRIFGVCLRMLGDRDAAADLTQETFVKFIQGAQTFDERAKLSTWLVRVAMNACLSHLRSQKLRKHASLDAAIPPSLLRGGVVRSGDIRTPSEEEAFRLAEQTAPQRVEHLERQRLVAAALAQLEPEQRAILILRDVQGLEYDQIAAVLEIAGGTVKSRLFRARLALREALERLEAGKPPAQRPTDLR